MAQAVFGMLRRYLGKQMELNQHKLVIRRNETKPTYEEVCTDTTGHVESVEVDYDPEEISYEDLLKIFWNNHNPTTPNRQGPDIGTQYRSVVFFHTPEQEKTALEMKTKLNPLAKEKFNAEIVTEIKPAQEFYVAEEYHQQYFAKSNL